MLIFSHLISNIVLEKFFHFLLILRKGLKVKYSHISEKSLIVLLLSNIERAIFLVCGTRIGTFRRRGVQILIHIGRELIGLKV